MNKRFWFEVWVKYKKLSLLWSLGCLFCCWGLTASLQVCCESSIYLFIMIFLFNQSTQWMFGAMWSHQKNDVFLRSSSCRYKLRRHACHWLVWPSSYFSRWLHRQCTPSSCSDATAGHDASFLVTLNKSLS